MISYVNGVLTEIEEKSIVVEANGIGYSIFVPMTVIPHLNGIGSSVKIYTYMHVSDDAQKLYGFTSRNDREIFKMLIGVNGVGPKAAIGVLSVLNADELKLAVIAEDEKAISRAPGLGAKTAKKIILELKDKFSGDYFSGMDMPKVPEGAVSKREDAIAALVSLGYSASQALSAINKIDDIKDMEVDEIIGLALKNLAI